MYEDIHTYVYTYKHTYIHTYIHTCIHTYIHAYIHACIYAYIYIHTHIHIRQADMTEQLRSGQHFLPEFLCKYSEENLGQLGLINPRIDSRRQIDLEDDQDTQPPAPWKSVSYQPRKKISKDKARVDELCRNANDTYKSYSQVQKVKFDEHPEERIFDLHLKLEMASAQIQRQKQKIELLQRAQGSPTKRKHVANSDRTSHTNPNKNVSRGNPVRLPSIFSGSSKMVSLREGSPTVEKNKFPSRVLFRNLDHRAVQEKGNKIAHQTSSGDEDIKRLRMLWDHTTNLPTGKFKMGPQPLQEGTWPPTAGKGLMKTAVFDKGPHPQGGTPVSERVTDKHHNTHDRHAGIHTDIFSHAHAYNFTHTYAHTLTLNLNR